GNPVAGPVVAVFVADHRLDGPIGGVGGGGGVGQHVGRVEHVQPLVFHGTHVEVAGGHDHEAVEVEFQAVTAFVPAQRTQQAVHGPFGAVLGAVVAVDLQQHVAAAAGGGALLAAGEVARHDGEQIAGFGVRVFPHGFVTALAQIALRQQVPVGK